MTEAEWLACDDPERMIRWLITDMHGGEWRPSRPSDRKLRLFACACARSPGWGGPGHWFNLHVTSVEEWADGGPAPPCDNVGGSDGMVVLARGTAREAADWWAQERTYVGGGDPAQKAAQLREVIGNPFRPLAWKSDYLSNPEVFGRVWLSAKARGRKDALAQILADEWRTADVLRLAQDAYESRDFSSLPVLADALEEAGCPAELTCPECRGRGMVSSPPGMEALLLAEEGADASTLSGCWVVCPECREAKKVPHPLLAHLRSSNPHVRGCWAVDLLLNKE